MLTTVARRSAAWLALGVRDARPERDGVVLLIAAITARSVALAGFGVDSLIEIGASIVVVWHWIEATHIGTPLS